MCNDFLNGRCFRASCKFSHDGNAPPGGGGGGGYGGGGSFGGGGRGGGPPPRDGDWNCSACGASNFARRTECFKCYAPMSGGGGGGGGYGGGGDRGGGGYV